MRRASSEMIIDDVAIIRRVNRTNPDQRVGMRAPARGDKAQDARSSIGPLTAEA